MRLCAEKFNKSAFDFNLAIHPVVIDICSPLFSNTYVKHFRYMRMYRNYKYLSIGTNLEYLKHYLYSLKEPGKIFEPAKIFASPTLIANKVETRYFLWPNQYSSNIKDPLFKTLYEFNVWNGFTISKYADDYVETWSFATDKTAGSTAQFYINNLPLLDQFVIYFQKKILKFIQEIDDEKLAVFQTPFNLNCIPSAEMQYTNDILPAKSNFQIFKNLCENPLVLSLSNREIECLFYIANGKTMKNIAKIMNISPRTVEAYIQGIKRKTNVIYKTDLSTLISLDEMMLYKQLCINSLH